MVDKPAAQELRSGEHHRADPHNDDQLDEINVIFRGSMSIISMTHGKELEREISLAQRIEPDRRMKWSDTDISFSSKDHPETELSNRNLPFVIKLPIERHNVAKTLVYNGVSLNLIMRKTFIDIGFNLADLTPVHDTFHGIIPGQWSSPIRCINLKVSYGSGDNKRREMLTLEVASFDIGYKCILGRPFLLKFMVAIHTAYATIKMPGPNGVNTIKAGQ
jgi:hypothetical protein